MSSPVCVDKVLKYVIRCFGRVSQVTVPVPLHHISEAEAGYNVSDILVDNVGAVFFSLTLVGFP